tara:strand:+ start:8222 stop:8869 length:648 start_codon:yes stop_codon:yes gene_type:complete
MKILVGCEESQAVTIELRKLGHEAYSCDLLPCSGGHPEWHIQGDVFEAIESNDWDMGIFFPPCTFLCVTGNKWMKPEFKKRFPDRSKKREEAVNFFLKIYNCNINKIAIENPVGIMSTRFRKPNQYVQPYMFGDKHSKKTGLWLKGLPKLIETKIVEPEMYIYKDGRKDPIWHVESMRMPKKERTLFRSKTFPGIAKAMAEQWTNPKEELTLFNQ